MDSQEFGIRKPLRAFGDESLPSGVLVRASS